MALDTRPEVITPLEALIRRTEMLCLDRGGEDGTESLATRCLRRLQQREVETSPASSGQVLIDLCSPSSSESSELRAIDIVDVIDLSRDG